MTQPSPSRNRRRLPYHTDADMLELEARGGIHAGMLPSNYLNATPVDGVSGLAHTAEQDARGWTTQQPWSHVDCPVMHLCILCAKRVDPDDLRGHVCRVAFELEQAA